MLRATVRLGRTVSDPSHSGDYSVSLGGEIPFGPDDPEGVLEKVAELFHLADEALAREIDRGREAKPISLDEPEPRRAMGPHTTNSAGAGPTESKSAAATPKQVWYLLNLAKRNGLSRDELHAVIARVTGSPKQTGELTKRDAGQVIDHLNNQEPAAAP